jgi:hypothetical protein
MQQNNYIEAEDAYRRALATAPDNNKMCNLGICLMKQGRIGEAKETLRRVKPAVADGPRGVDSHLKAYERAQQMLKDLESEMMSKGGDRVEQRRLFDAFLGSSSIWQPQPCKDHLQATSTKSHHDDFANENVDSNIVSNQNQMLFPQQNSVKQFAPFGNLWNVDAPPFYSSKLVKEPIKESIGYQFHDKLKRTRSGNVASSNRKIEMGLFTAPSVEPENPETKTRRLSDETEDKVSQLLPDNDDFEEAILAAVLGPARNAGKTAGKVVETANSGTFQQKKMEKRLKVFQDITLSLSPRA